MIVPWLFYMFALVGVMDGLCEDAIHVNDTRWHIVWQRY